MKLKNENEIRNKKINWKIKVKLKKEKHSTKNKKRKIIREVKTENWKTKN